MEEKNKPQVRVEKIDEDPLDNAKIRLVVEVERIFDPNRSKNNLMMTMGACDFTDENEKRVGEILHGIPAHSVIRDKETGEDWVLNYGVLFHAYKEAREKFEADQNLEAREGTVDEFQDDGVILDESGFTSGAGVGEELTKHYSGVDDDEDVILKVDELDPDNDKVGC